MDGEITGNRNSIFVQFFRPLQLLGLWFCSLQNVHELILYSLLCFADDFAPPLVFTLFWADNFVDLLIKAVTCISNIDLMLSVLLCFKSTLHTVTKCCESCSMYFLTWMLCWWLCPPSFFLTLPALFGEHNAGEQWSGILMANYKMPFLWSRNTKEILSKSAANLEKFKTFSFGAYFLGLNLRLIDHDCEWKYIQRNPSKNPNALVLSC